MEAIRESKNGRSLRGALKKYADKTLVNKESYAWINTVEEKYRNS